MSGLMTLIATAVVAQAGGPPAPLQCLSTWYAVHPQRGPDGRWVAALDDGAVVPWDDGRAKGFEERLAAPDVEDAFSIPYRGGPIRPVTAPDEDPGRIRVDPLFRATFGHTEEEVRARLEPVVILGQTLLVHRRARPAFERVAGRLAALVKRDPALRPFLENLGGTFAWRKIANADRQSAHSFGVSLDINVKRSAYWEWQTPKEPIRWKNAIPQAIVDAFEAEGFIWGGRWYHYDTMHFELRPELLEPRCRSR
ncbi:MAG TPA: M15 family metallopeptidase [Myxococcaceae bacterium]|nr:M15 family metallopeptidase [Myxococcaceae bacterium]